MNRLHSMFVCVLVVFILGAGCKQEGTVTDIDGNVYRTITIGQQEWMAENLRTASYSTGSSITNITDMDEWEENTSEGSWVYYENDESHDAVYGKLYNWFAVTDTQGLCPEGWHVPSGDEWNILTDYLGGSDTAGCSMKEAGTSHWENPNTCANNLSGFTALPGGYHDPSGFVNIGRYGGWWSTDEDNEARAWFHTLNYDNSALWHLFMVKKNDLSVRCVKD